MLPLAPRHIPALGPPKLSPRSQILAEWRRCDLSQLERAAAIRAKPVSALLPAVLSDLRIDRRRGEAEIVKVWNSVLDPHIIAHAQPTGLHKGTLFVSVDSSPWLSEIVRYRRKEILARLQHSFGRDVISKISFRVG